MNNPVTINGTRHTLSELADRYLDEQKPALTYASHRKLGGVLSLLKRVFGGGVLMTVFTPAAIQDYKSILGKLPANAVKKYGDLPIDELLRKAEGAKPMTRTTANSHLQKTLSFLRWCAANA